MPMLAADNWCLKVNDRVYGPYTSRQLRKFAHEGRFIANSLISPAGSREWRQAHEETAFASFFGASQKPQTNTPKAFGRSHAGKPAARSRANVVDRNEPAQGQRFSVQTTAPTVSNQQQSESNFIIIFDVASATANRVESALSGLGPCFRLAENVWAVRCPLTAIGVRNSIGPFLRPNEPVFVVDATNGRTCWQNYAPEPHAKISAAFMHQKN